MRPTPADTAARTSLFIRVGGWFEARATGWGIVVVPIVLAGLVAAAHLLTG